MDSYVQLMLLLRQGAAQYERALRDELVRAGFTDLSHEQALMIAGIADGCRNQTSLDRSSWFPGTNANYNIGKLETSGYLRRTKEPCDRRAVRLDLTDRGEEALACIEAIHARQRQALEDGGVTLPALDQAAKTARRVAVQQATWSKT